MPRWLAIATYTLALALLVVVNYNVWITLVFPGWVLWISLLILLQQRKQPDQQVLTPQ
jgi:type IV secretory pathway TrbD component